MKFVIEVKELTKVFKEKTVVNKLSLHVKAGEIFGFLGPNGSGKTTSIRMMCGLLSPTSGTGVCLGQDISTSSNKIKSQIAYMPQRFSLYNDLTITENLNFMANMFEVKASEVVPQIIERFDLSSYKNTVAGNLSGGWKQRLALAACLVHDPKILFLDEPTAGVDPAARGEFWAILHNLASSGISILVSTHYMDEAIRCHSLAYIFNGVLLVEGKPDEIIERLNICVLQVKGGEKLANYIPKIRSLKGVSEVIIYGQEVHVVGKNLVVLEKSLAQFMQSLSFMLEIKKVEPSLEDAFIYLMLKTKNQKEQ